MMADNFERMRTATNDTGSRHERVVPCRARNWTRTATMLAVVMAATSAMAWAATPTSKPKPGASTQTSRAPEVVVYAQDIPKQGLSEFDRWKDAVAPGGVVIGTSNSGDELDPPPENDPHVTFKLNVQGGVAYRCWIHMKVGKAKGKSQANLLFVQFSNAVGPNRQPALRPGTGSYLSLRGPAREGWVWVGGDMADPKAAGTPVHFASSGEATVRIQAGMEGVAFDQFVLSPARYLSSPPAEPVVKK